MYLYKSLRLTSPLLCGERDKAFPVYIPKHSLTCQLAKSQERGLPLTHYTPRSYGQYCSAFYWVDNIMLVFVVIVYLSRPVIQKIMGFLHAELHAHNYIYIFHAKYNREKLNLSRDWRLSGPFFRFKLPLATFSLLHKKKSYIKGIPRKHLI